MQLQCTLSCNIICYYDFLSFMLLYFTFLLFLTVNKSFAKSLCYSSLISIIQDIDSIIYEPANCERKSWQLKVMVKDSFLVLKMYFLTKASLILCCLQVDERKTENNRLMGSKSVKKHLDERRAGEHLVFY